MNRYYIDTNAVNSTRFKAIREARDKRLLEYVIIEEIAYESKGNTRQNEGDKIAKESVPAVDIKTIEVLFEHVPHMIDSGILKLDEGNGEVMLFAARESGDQQSNLLGEENIMVTRDKKFETYCKKHNVPYIHPSDFFRQFEQLLAQKNM